MLFTNSELAACTDVGLVYSSKDSYDNFYLDPYRHYR